MEVVNDTVTVQVPRKVAAQNAFVWQNKGPITIPVHVIPSGVSYDALSIVLIHIFHSFR